jgi:hypothetical protein
MTRRSRLAARAAVLAAEVEDQHRATLAGALIAEVDATFHLPGKHDQSTHGRKKKAPATPKAPATKKAAAPRKRAPAKRARAVVGGVTAFGDEVRPALAKARDVAEVARVLSVELSLIVDDEVRVDLAGADLDVAKGFAEGLIQVAERYPATPLREVGTYAPGRTDGVAPTHNARMAAWAPGLRTAFAFAVRGGETNEAGGNFQGPSARLPNGHTTIGTAVYLNVDKSTRSWEDFAVSARLAREGLVDREHVTATPREVAIHEGVHAVAAHGRPLPPEYAVGIRVSELTAAQAAQAGTVEKLRRQVEQGLTTQEEADRWLRVVAPRQLVANGVSVYAATDADLKAAELTAEAVADVIINGDKATALSRELTQVADEHIRGYEREVTRR